MNWSHRVLPCVQEHDEVLGPGVAVLDLALVAVAVHAELGRVESRIGLLDAGLGGNGGAAGRGGASRGWRLGLGAHRGVMVAGEVGGHGRTCGEGWKTS